VKVDTNLFKAAKKSVVAGLMTLGFLVALAPAARADLIYNSTQGLCCFSVDLHQVSSTDVFVSVTLTGGATLFANTGNPTNHPGFAFNLGGSAITGANILNAVNLSTFHVGPDVTSGPDFGTFGYFFDIPGSGTSGNDAGPLQFDVSRASGVLITDFGANPSGYFFAADILNGTTAMAAINTPGTPSVPEPVTLSLVGSGLLALGLLRKRFSA
jgi:hypothetical protein